MKKATIIFLAVLTCFSLVSFSPKSDIKYIKKKTTTQLVVQPYNPSNVTVNCYRNSDPYWDGYLCCCNIKCDFSSGGSCEFRICIDNFSTEFVSNPPSTTPSFYELDANCSLEDSQTYTTGQISYFNSFKTSGEFNISNDISNTDVNGNVTIIKAGNYKVTNNKIQALVSKITL